MKKRGIFRGTPASALPVLGPPLFLLLLLLLALLLPRLSPPARADEPSASLPVITRQPAANHTYAENATARFYLHALSPDRNDAETGNLSYQWYISGVFKEKQDAGAVTGSAIKNIDSLGNSATSATLTITTPAPTDAGAHYVYVWAEITNTFAGDTAKLKSRVAEAKIVDRELAPALVKGDFNDAKNNYHTPNLSVEDHWPRKNPQGAYLNKFRWETCDYVTNHPLYSTNPKKYPNGAMETDTPSGFNNGGISSLPDDTSRGLVVELAATASSSLFQEIATVPGKIYEWSFDHAARSYTKEGIGLVIGPTINEKSDYGANVTNRWGQTDLAGKNSRDFAYAGAAKTDDAALKVYHLGGGNNSYMNDIFNAFAAQEGKNLYAIIDDSNYLYKPLTADYNGHTYYIYLATTLTNDKWKTYSGVYTVPAGQGTTLFSWCGLLPENTGMGNLLDNVKFASGTELTETQSATYAGESSLSVTAKAGCVYGLAEVRGSDAVTLDGVSAYFDPDGTDGEAPAADAEPEGIEGCWYAGTVAADVAGVITFKDLTPGKTYRITGIPKAAVNKGLNANRYPADVLDEGYYTDVKMLPAKGEDDEEYVAAVTAGLDDKSEEESNAFVTVANTRSDAQYALLPEIPGSDPGAPDTGGPHTGGSENWRNGGGEMLFPNLVPGATYYLIARPLGYTAITYAEAALGPDGNLSATKIKTPEKGAEEVPDPATDLKAVQVTRREAGTEETGDAITITGITAGHTYAIIDILTGAIFAEKNAADAVDGTLEFKDIGLDPSTTYRVAIKPTPAAGETDNSVYMKGVRVYPFAKALAVDYENETMKLAPAEGEGADASLCIPKDTEYLISPAAVTADLTPGTLEWTPGTGAAYIDLTATLDAPDGEGGTVIVRRRAENTYIGEAVYPGRNTEFPARPAAPEPGTGYNILYTADPEKLEAAETVGYRTVQAGAYTELAKSASVTLANLGWPEDKALTVWLRFPAGETSFASFPKEQIIPARGDAPAGIITTISQGKITFSGLDASKTYQYKLQSTTTWNNTDPNSGSLTLELKDQDYDLRFAPENATQGEGGTPGKEGRPASFPVTLSSPLAVSNVHFGVVYGQTTSAAVKLTNYSDKVISGIKIEFDDGGDADKFVFEYITGSAIASPGAISTGSAITSAAAISVKAGSTNGESVKIRPKYDTLNAGQYNAVVKATYTYTPDDESSDPIIKIAMANVLFTVSKADWDMSGIKAKHTLNEAAPSTGFKTDITEGAPPGAVLSWQVGVAGFKDDDADNKVPESGEAAKEFQPVRLETMQRHFRA